MDAHSHSFRKWWSFIWGCPFLMSILKSIAKVFPKSEFLFLKEPKESTSLLYQFSLTFSFCFWIRYLWFLCKKLKSKNGILKWKFKLLIIDLTVNIILDHLKDTHREKAPSNKTPVLRKSINMGVWAVGTLNQLFKRFLNWNKTFKKNKIVTGKTQFSVTDPFCSYHSICLNIGFSYGSFVWKWCSLNLSALN